MNRLNAMVMDSLEVQRRCASESDQAQARTSPVVQTCFIPQHYEANYAYPLVVWLHGSGCDERQLWEVMPVLSTRNYMAVAPRGLSLAGEKQFGWPQTPEAIMHADHAIDDCIEQIATRFHIGSDRIFLAGVGEGGTMAMRIALMSPERFAGVLSLGGPLPQGMSPLRNLAHARQLQMWFAFPMSYPDINDVCGDLRLLHSAGIHVMLRQYHCKEQVAPKMLTDINKWIMERVTGTDTSAELVQPSAFGDAN